jgi:hypothetical protein
MSDGSGCIHAETKRSMRIPTSMECAQCGLLQLEMFRRQIATLKADKVDLLILVSELQDEVCDRDAELDSIKVFCQSEIRKLPPEYIKYKGDK